MRILFALSGLHRHERGAEVAFTSLASELVRQGDQVTLIGSGYERPGTGYDFLHAGAVSREAFEQWPQMPVLRGDTAYEEATFAPGLLRRYRPDDYDVTVTCSFPFTNWVLRRPAKGGRPPHVFVTQNGDWPAVLRRRRISIVRMRRAGLHQSGLFRAQPAQVELGADPERHRLWPASDPGRPTAAALACPRNPRSS